MGLWLTKLPWKKLSYFPLMPCTMAKTKHGFPHKHIHAVPTVTEDAVILTTMASSVTQSISQFN